MKDTAPIGSGILAVAALFGVVGGAMALVMWDYTFLGALFLAIIIALIVAFILWLGWRPANDNSRDMSAEAHRAGEAPTTSATGGDAAVTSAANGAATTDTAHASADMADAGSDGTADAATSDASGTSSAAAAAPAVKSGTLLPGETELNERKGTRC